MTNTQLQDARIYAQLERLVGIAALVRDYRLNTRQRSAASQAGPQRSRARGRGMEFAEVRHYQPGDDVRNIDWRVTARTLETYTKLFQEERERPVLVLLDQRAPMFFGSKTRFKSVLAAELAAAIAWCTIQNNDKLGAMVFSSSEQSDARPKRGKHAALHFVQDIMRFNHSLHASLQPDYQQGLPEMLMELVRVARPGSQIFIISDFHDLDARSDRPMSLLARHSELHCVHIYDELERQLPERATLTLQDEDGRFNINTRQAKTQRRYQQDWEGLLGDIAARIQKHRGVFSSVSTSRSLEQVLPELFAVGRLRSRGGEL